MAATEIISELQGMYDSIAGPVVLADPELVAKEIIEFAKIHGLGRDSACQVNIADEKVDVVRIITFAQMVVGYPVDIEVVVGYPIVMESEE